MERILEYQFLLEENLLELSDQNQKIDLIKKHIRKGENEKVILDDFGNGMEWFNTTGQLSLHKNFKGKIIVLDFFTYCCINCMHLLPTLDDLESQYSENEEVVVIGVHSAKFDNERSSINVAKAILRYNITHPVINDPTAVLWDKYNINCWPTLVILGPELQVLFVLVGENVKEKLFLYTELAVGYFTSHKSISTAKFRFIKLLKNSAVDSLLSYPGKVLYDAQNQIIIISDSGHHRVIIATKEGLVKDVIGGPEKGLRNGSYKNAQFNNPQGISCYQGKYIFIADTGNHSIRKIDLLNKSVETIIGIGLQGNDLEGGKLGIEQPIASPWDLCLGPPIGSNDEFFDDVILYIAMAGTHQIWGYCLDSFSVKSRVYKKHTCFVVAGNGNEENRNNCYPKKAGFAQPSGLIFAKSENPDDKISYFYVADSESSSIRSISLVDGSVKAVVGGDRNPNNLFSYGNKDGNGYDVKLQHPMGLTYCKKRNQLWLADTYNHTIKVIKPSKKECTTLERINELNEPSGLYLWEDTLYIADTNNHEIKQYNLVTEKLQKLPLYPSPVEFEDETDSKCRAASNKSFLELSVSPVEINQGGHLHLLVNIEPSENFTFTEGAPHSWSLTAPDLFISSKSKGSLIDKGNSKGCEIELEVNHTSLLKSSCEILIIVRAFVCDKETGVCLVREARWLLKTTVVDNIKLDNVNASLNWKVGK